MTADVLEGAPPSRPLPRPSVPLLLALGAAVVLAAGLGTTVRLLRVDVAVQEGVGGAVRSQSQRVQGDVALLVRNDGRLPLRVERAALDVQGVTATTTGRPGRLAPGQEAAVDVRFTIAACEDSRPAGRLRLRVRPEHGPARDVALPVSVDGRDGSARIATLLGFCAPPFS